MIYNYLYVTIQGKLTINATNNAYSHSEPRKCEIGSYAQIVRFSSPLGLLVSNMIYEKNIIIMADTSMKAVSSFHYSSGTDSVIRVCYFQFLHKTIGIINLHKAIGIITSVKTLKIMITTDTPKSLINIKLTLKKTFKARISESELP